MLNINQTAMLQNNFLKFHRFNWFVIFIQNINSKIIKAAFNYDKLMMKIDVFYLLFVWKITTISLSFVWKIAIEILSFVWKISTIILSFVWRVSTGKIVKCIWWHWHQMQLVWHHHYFLTSLWICVIKSTFNLLFVWSIFTNHLSFVRKISTENLSFVWGVLADSLLFVWRILATDKFISITFDISQNY